MKSSPIVAGLAAVAAVATGLWSEQAAQAADFYAGKRLTVMINYAAGGPADIEGRFFAKHIARHIAGGPTVIVQNMDGAGGMVAASYLAEIAPKDGSMLGMLTGTAWQIATDQKTRKTDLKSFEFVAYQPSTSVYFMRTDVKPGIKSPVDLGKAEGLVVGGLAADSSKDILLRLTLDLLGHKYKYVTGYRGSNAARLAMQQGEINFYSESPPSYRTVVTQQLINNGAATPVFYDPNWDGKSLTRSKQVDGLDIKGFHELYREIKGQPPKGQLWETYLAVRLLTGELFRIAVFPPGTPKPAIEAIQAAVNKLADDKQFADEAMATFHYIPEFVAEPSTNANVRERLNTPQEMKQFVADYVKSGSRTR